MQYIQLPHTADKLKAALSSTPVSMPWKGKHTGRRRASWSAVVEHCLLGMQQLLVLCTCTFYISAV